MERIVNLIKNQPVRWPRRQPLYLSSQCGANNPPDENLLVMKLTRTEENWTDPHGNWPWTQNINNWPLDLKYATHIATWRVCSLLQLGAVTLLSLELDRYNIALVGLCETRWPIYGECTVGNHYIIWSGPTDGPGQCGVALVMPKHLCTSFIGWKLVSNQLLTAQFLHKHSKMIVTMVNAHTDVRDEDIKDM